MLVCVWKCAEVGEREMDCGLDCVKCRTEVLALSIFQQSVDSRSLSSTLSADVNTATDLRIQYKCTHRKLFPSFLMCCCELRRMS
jgi:hypothetical protein